MRAGATSGESFGAAWLRPRAPLTGEEVGMAGKRLFSYYGNPRRVLEIEEATEYGGFQTTSARNGRARGGSAASGFLW